MESYSICLFVTYFIEHNVFKVHPGCSLYQNFLLFLKKKVSMAVPGGSCGIKEILVEARGSLVLQTLSCSMRSSSLTRDRTQAPFFGSLKS